MVDPFDIGFGALNIQYNNFGGPTPEPPTSPDTQTSGVYYFHAQATKATQPPTNYIMIWRIVLTHFDSGGDELESSYYQAAPWNGVNGDDLPDNDQSFASISLSVLWEMDEGDYVTVQLLDMNPPTDDPDNDTYFFNIPVSPSSFEGYKVSDLPG